MYDITKMESFDNIKKYYIPNINSHVYDHASRLLVGNKSDLTSKCAVETAIAKEFADSLGIPFFETSAKNATNVEEVFITLVSEIKKIMASIAQQQDGSISNVSFEPQSEKHIKELCSC